jgi:alkyldihydroxyacetonephosphate synthase
VGKIRQDFLSDVYSESALKLQRELKAAVDPDNLFGAGNHAVRGRVALSTKTGESHE